MMLEYWYELPSYLAILIEKNTLLEEQHQAENLEIASQYS